MDPRSYLLNRFETDRDALALRAEQLSMAASKPGAPKPPGPDAATSRDMADACSAVVTMVQTAPESATATEQIVVLSGFIPTLEQLGARTQLTPAVRSVYVGAATRIREIATAEVRAHTTPDNGSGDDGEHGDGDDE